MLVNGSAATTGDGAEVAGVFTLVGAGTPSFLTLGRRRRGAGTSSEVDSARESGLEEVPWGREDGVRRFRLQDGFGKEE